MQDERIFNPRLGVPSAAIKANLFFLLVGSMIKKENDFIEDNLVDISGLVQLGVETASTPWDNLARAVTSRN